MQKVSCEAKRNQAQMSSGFILVILALQTQLLSLQLAQKAFLLGLVFFIVVSALLQNIFDVLEPHLLQLGMENTLFYCKRTHFRCDYNRLALATHSHVAHHCASHRWPVPPRLRSQSLPALGHLAADHHEQLSSHESANAQRYFGEE